MGFLKLFGSKSARLRLMPLPSGSFSLDRDGQIMTSTLPRSFPADHLREIGQLVLDVFRGAQKAQMPMTEIIIHYAALKLLARELRGGAIIFIMPLAPAHPR